MGKICTKKYELFIQHSSLRYNCYFCGLKAPYFDYSPPLNIAGNYEGLNSPYSFVKVPICKECKDLSSQCYEDLLQERFYEIKRLIERKYEKELKPLNWTNEELEELDFPLQEYVKAHKKLAESIKARLAWGIKDTIYAN